MAEEKRENWGSMLGFVLAIAGSAIGLGNVWKFPYITGLNGGGAFVLVYLLCVILLGMPIMLCEMIIGRRTGKNPYAAFKALQLRRSRLADLIGALLLLAALALAWSGSIGQALLALFGALAILWLGFSAVGLYALLAAMIILSYYSVIGGWILEYVYQSFTNTANAGSVDAAAEAFGGFITKPGRVMMWHFLFLALAAAMLWAGIRNGIERWSKILMPTLFFLLLAVIVRSLTLPGASAGVSFFLTPDFSHLSAGGALEALGHAFYTLSLGMAITMTYGSYLKKNENLFSSSLLVILVDTMAAMMAGLAIFPAVFAMGLNPAEGPSLIFKVLPVAFHNFPGGYGWIWAGLFFLMLSIAALTSAASLLECGVTFLIDQFKLSRKVAILICYAGCGGLGVLSAVSVADWQHIPGVYRVMAALFGEESLATNWFDTLDYVTSNWMLPLSGLLTSLFVGWVWGTKKAGRELRRGAESFADENLITTLSGFRGEPLYRTSRNHGLTLMTLWGILVRFCAPLVVLIVFLKAIGWNVGF